MQIVFWDTLAETKNLMLIEMVGETTTHTEFDLHFGQSQEQVIFIKYISDFTPFSMISQKLLNIIKQDPDYIQITHSRQVVLTLTLNS